MKRNDIFRDDLFAATPPLEAKKALFSLAVSKLVRNRAQARKTTYELMFIDVKRA